VTTYDLTKREIENVDSQILGVNGLPVALFGADIDPSLPPLVDVTADPLASIDPDVLLAMDDDDAEELEDDFVAKALLLENAKCRSTMPNSRSPRDLSPVPREPYLPSLRRDGHDRATGRASTRDRHNEDKRMPSSR
jgi:hypothetical protein